MATSYDVARLAGVSQPTVSRALRGDPRVTVSTAQRVAAAARALDYFPSQLGRSLATKATHRVAMVADLTNPLYPTLVQPIHDALEGHGYRMVLLAERDDDHSGYAPLLDGTVDGVILTTTRRRSPLPFELARHAVPSVMLNRTSDVIDTDSVVADNVAAGRIATELLLVAGYRDIGFLAGPTETSTGRDREAGVREAMANAAQPWGLGRVVYGWFSHDAGTIGMRELMQASHPPRAVVCVSDSVAIGALNAARGLGLRVPQDVALVGIDDVPAAGWDICDLSTVSLPLTEMAKEAANLLVDRLTGAQTGQPVHRVHPVAPVPRGSH